jgi:2-haloacid dehalogenase
MTVQALTFDTYGTVVDWRDSVLAKLAAFGAARGLDVDWPAFLAEWYAGYRAGMDRVNSNEWPWTTVEAIYRRRLEEIRASTSRGSARISRTPPRCGGPPSWPRRRARVRRLRARSSSPALRGLRRNGPSRQVRRAALGLHHHGGERPPPSAAGGHRTAVRLLGLRPAEVMLVAAHNYDPAAARASGLGTAFVPAPRSTAAPDVRPRARGRLGRRRDRLPRLAEARRVTRLAPRTTLC